MYFALGNKDTLKVMLLCTTEGKRIPINESDFIRFHVVNGAWDGFYDSMKRRVYFTDGDDYGADLTMLWSGPLPNRLASYNTYNEAIAYVEKKLLQK